MKSLPVIVGSLALVVLVLTLCLKPCWLQGEAAPYQVEGSPNETLAPVVGPGGPGSTESTEDLRVAREVANLYVPPGATGQPRIYLYPDGLPQSRGEACGTPIPAGLKEGRYGFLEEDPEGVLVAECEPCVPMVLELRRGEPLPQIRFAMSSPAEVVVRAGEGAAIPGAQLTVAASTPLGWWTRKVLVGDDGRTLVCMTADKHVLTATSGALRSRAWSGTPKETKGPIVLLIESTFSAHGQVQSGSAGAGTVSVRLRRATGRKGDQVADLDDAGHWRIDDIPWADEEFVFRFEGEGHHPAEVWAHPPYPGVDLQVDFEVSAGVSFTVIVASEGTPVPGALVTPISRTLTDAFPGIGVVTDELGVATLPNVKTGRLAFVTKKDGFAENVYGPTEVIEGESEPLRIELVPGATITGEVTRDGKPVREFTVLAWDSAGFSVTESFNTEEGVFRLARMHAGPSKVTVFSADAPPCPPVELDLQPGEERSLRFELGASRQIAGNVVDSNTGEQLPGVRVEALMPSDAGIALRPYGPAIRTGQDGRFDIGVSTSATIVSFKADGFELAERLVPSDALDLGVVGLSRLQRLKVELVGDSILDFDQYQVALHTDTSFGPINADEAGVAWFDGVDPGFAHVQVFPPGGGRFDQEATLEPGDTWAFQVPVVGTRTVEVEVVQADGTDLPPQLWLMGCFAGPDGRTYASYAPVEDGQAFFDLATGSHAYLELILSSGEKLLRRSVELTEGNNHFRWEIRSPRKIQIVDPDGTPQGGAYGFFRIPGDPINEWRGGYADANGIVSAADFEGDVAELITAAGESVSRVNLLDFSNARDGLLEVKIDRKSSVELMILNADGPVGGVAATLYPGPLKMLETELTSNLDGSVRFNALQAGTYRLEVGGQGWWKTERDVEAAQVASTIHIPARRLASVELSIRKDGIPVSGAQVTLTSLTEGDDVSAWVTSGRVAVSGDSSGTSGRWSIQGIPDGRYRWLIEHPTATKAGEIEVVGGSQEFVCTLD